MTEKETFIRVGTTLYKIVNQPRIDGGYVRKRIALELRDLASGLRQGLHGGHPEV